MANDTDAFENLMHSEEDHPKKYILQLYITGMTPNSTRAVENITTICEKYVKDNYDLEIIDIYQQPALAEEAQIIAAPTLIKHAPYPLRRLVGDMSNTEKVLSGLDLSERNYGGQ